MAASPATRSGNPRADRGGPALLLDSAYAPHRDLRASGLPSPTARLVTRPSAALAGRAPGVTGLSCLADGADQIFARAVTGLGGTLEVVVPAAGYRAGLLEDSHPGYDALLAQAAAVRRLPFTASTPESHMAASRRMVDEADELTRCGTASPLAPTAGPPTWWPTPASTAPRCA